MKKLSILTLILVLSIFQIAAQIRVISGTIRDENGNPMPGVNVVEKGTRNGTITNLSGTYSITLLTPGNPLQFSFIGYELIEEQTNSSIIDINMTPELTSLDEVVVVGYSTQRKASLVGSIATTTSDELQKMGTPNLSQALAGRVSGVITMVGSGRPGGDDAEIYIRGVATLSSGNSTPLILVDGVERDFMRVDPEDIESFSVLKDASATAVYGVRGANGVILVTTKRGRIGKPEISIRYSSTIQQPTRLPTFLGSYEHANLRNEALANDGALPRFSQEDIEHYKNQDSPYTHPDNDYIADFLKKSTGMHTVNVNVRGGTDRLRYFMGTNAMMQDGLYKQFDDARYPSNAHYKQLNLRSNLDFDITKTTTMSLDLNSRIQREQNTSVGDIESTSIFEDMYRTPPLYYPYLLPNGAYGTNKDDSQATNILALLNEYGYSRTNDNILEGTYRITQKLDAITKGLSARFMVSFNTYYKSGTKKGYRPEVYSYDPLTEEYKLMNEELTPWISALSSSHRRRNQMEGSLNWTREFGIHNLSAMFLYTQTQGWTNQTLPQGFMGYVGRTTYALKHRYLAEFNFAYNGSDQFEKENRFGFFPSVSLGWIVSQESFMRNNMPSISFLKFRGSYGVVGNDRIGSDRFLFLQTYSTGGNYFFGTDTNFGPYSTLYEGDLGNENVTWEIGKKSNLGMELIMFREKFSVEVDLFRENRENIFVQRTTSPTILGVGLPKENIGKVKNEGYEIETKYQDKVGKIGFFVKGLVSYAKNTIVYKDEIAPEYEYMRETGKPVGQNFGLLVLDYYTPNDFQQDESGNLILGPGNAPILIEGLPIPSYGVVQPGDFKYWDRNGDSAINTFDHGPIGNTRIPRYVFSFSSGLNYGGFDLSMLLQGAAGHHKFITGAGAWEPIRERDKFLEIHRDRWTLERWQNGEEIRYPRLSSVQSQHNHQNNSFFQKKGDYLRLKNIEIGYNIPKRALEKLGIGSLRVYAIGTNLLTFDHIKIFDPEVGPSSGIEYPQMKLWSFGLNVRL